MPFETEIHQIPQSFNNQSMHSRANNNSAFWNS